MNRRSVTRAHPLTHRECLILDRIGRDLTHKNVAAELGVSINTVADLAARAYRKLGAHSAAAAVPAHRDPDPWCGKRIDLGPVLEQVRATRSAWTKRHLVQRDGRPRRRMVSRGAGNDGRLCSAARVVAPTAPTMRSSRLVPARADSSQFIRKA